MTQEEHLSLVEPTQTYRLTKHIEVSFTVSAHHVSRAMGIDEAIQIHVTDKQGNLLQQGRFILSVDVTTVNDGFAIERLETSREVTASLAHALARWQMEGIPAFWRWLEHYEVDACSGIFSDEQIAQYGFPLPDRPADAIWSMPDALTKQSTDYSIASKQWEWWQEGGDVIGIKQAGDDVMGCDHFTWYRIPVSDIAQRMLEVAKIQL